MAEKPRLKKSDEILGSIAAEPAKKTRGGDGSLRERKAKTPPPYIPDEDYDEEGFELEESLLPSAQSLAEKLMARENKRRKLNFEKYELPKRSPAAPSAQSSTAMEIPVAGAPGAASFDTAVEIPAAPAAQPPAVPFEAAVEVPAAPPLPPKPAAERSAPPSAAGSPVLFESRTASSPTVMEYTFESFEQPAAPAAPPDRPAPAADRRSIRERARCRAQPRPEPQAEQRREEPAPEFSFESSFEQEQAQVQPAPPAASAMPQEPQEFVFEDFQSRPQAAPPARPEPIRPEPPQPARPEPAAPPPASAAPELPETPEERRRREFLERISSQFEQQFGERFENGILQPRETSRPSEPPQKPRESIFDRPVMREEPSGASETVSPLTAAPDEDFYTAIKRREQERGSLSPEPERTPQNDANTQDFLSKFMSDVEHEEEQRAEDFKETLAEKFMRERERYLKDLGISIKEQEPGPQNSEPQASPAHAAPRRKLDFQIQPEMHAQDGEARPARAQPNITYNRGGAVIRPQADAPPAGRAPAERPAAPRPQIPKAPAKKTSEQLLIEHGRLAQKQTVKAPKKQKKADKPLKFTFETPEEQAKRKKAQVQAEKKKLGDMLPKEKWPRRIVFISMACGLAAIFLLVFPLVQYMNFSRNLQGQGDMIEPAVPVFEQDTLEVYETRSFDQTAQVSNVLFKNANIALRNVNVKDYVVIENVSQSGKIRLEDMNVDSAISLRSGGVGELELHNVRARRVIINNPDADVTLSVTGDSSIEAVEIRTPSSVRQLDIEGEAPGIRDMVITAAEGGANAILDGLSLSSLSTEARETILTFEGGTQAENMSIGGSLSLSGAGRVTNLAIGARTGQGAGDTEPAGTVSLIIKGVSVASLNIKSPVSANLSTQVDSLATSDDISIEGEGGSIGTFTVNPGQSTNRITADISGVSVNTAYTNAETRLNLSHSASINALVANRSTYILGNKVNHLIANANNIVYDVRPDSLTVADGVAEPINRADNPGYDLEAPTVLPQEGDENSALLGLAPTCGHAVENGGFVRGEGSRDSPYEVSTPLQLAHVAMHLDAFFIQTANISMADEPSLRDNFPMIGSGASPFAGVYDGAGFAVSGLNISSDAENVGLFAANSGIIQNLWLVSGTISSTSTSRASIGGIVGLNFDGGSIRASSNGASIFGNASSYTGGIAGQNLGSRIHDCFNYGNISGVDNVGGIAGVNRQAATIAGSYNAGVIEGRNLTGAVAGINEDATVTNTYYLVNTWETGIGEGGGTAVPKTSAELAGAGMAMELSAGNENTIWIAGQTSSNGYRYPMHRKP